MVMEITRAPPKKTFEITVPKLILRNLSFNLKEEQLNEELGKYGIVNQLFLARKDDGKLKGYGFVTYSTMKEAREALDFD